MLTEIKASLEYMSATEKKIAQFILLEPKVFLGLNLIELCAKLGVSQGSVINFSKKFAKGGFPKLKISVATSISASEDFFLEKNETGNIKSILKKTCENYASAVNNTLSLAHEHTLKEVADLVFKAKKVQIYGIYRSAIVATDLYFQLIQLGVPASFISDVLTCAISASMLDKNSLLIAVSYSGQTKDVIDAVKLAKSNGVKVVAITAHKNSVLASLSDLVIISSPSGNSSLNTQTEIRISQLAIVDTLCAYIRRETSDAKKYFEIEEILSTHNVKD